MLARTVAAISGLSYNVSSCCVGGVAACGCRESSAGGRAAQARAVGGRSSESARSRQLQRLKLSPEASSQRNYQVKQHSFEFTVHSCERVSFL